MVIGNILVVPMRENGKSYIPRMALAGLTLKPQPKCPSDLIKNLALSESLRLGVRGIRLLLL